MKRGPTGHFKNVTIRGKKLRAFIPKPLPPEPPIEFTPERQKLLERATLALGRLDSITLLLPDPGIFLYAYVRREALLSSQIEGTQSSLSDLLLFEVEEAPGAPLDDVVEVSNYVAALEHGIKRLQSGFPLSNRLIKEMHSILLSRGRGSHKSPGKFRRSQNWIPGARFVPPPPDTVEQCMADFERFINGYNAPYPTLVNAALAHVQFETIHPFLDGNGRMGRLLIAFILHHDGVLKRPLLYLSLFFKQNREEYYRLLDQVRIEGEWEAWLDFFMEGVETTAQNAVETAQRLVSLFEHDRHIIQTKIKRAGTTLRVFETLCTRPVITLKDISKKTGLSFATVSKGIEKLLKLGIVQEVTGKRRNRIFAYSKYLAILSEGTEPL